MLLSSPALPIMKHDMAYDDVRLSAIEWQECATGLCGAHGLVRAKACVTRRHTQQPSTNKKKQRLGY